MCSKTDETRNNVQQQYCRYGSTLKSAKITQINICNATSVNCKKKYATSTLHIKACFNYSCRNLLSLKAGYRLSSHTALITTASANVSATTSTSCIRPVTGCQGLRFCHFMALLTIGLVVWHNCISSACAAPQSCVLCDKQDLKSKDLSNNYEEFLFEHQVTRLDAVGALKAVNDSFYIVPSGCAVRCTEKVMKYCLGPQFINDHCWCELGHTEEGLPFVPHICYVGEKVYTASVGSCYFYDEVKECCCAPALAKQWLHISAATRYSFNKSLRLLSSVLLFGHILFSTASNFKATSQS